MKRLTVAAAALAAGMMAVVCDSQAESDRSLLKPSISGAKAARSAKPAEAKKSGEKEVAENAEGRKKTKLAGATKPRAGKKGREKIELASVRIDKRTTGSVARIRPELKAVARKAVKGLGAAEGKVAGAAAYATLVSRYASNYGVPASLAHAVISVESNYQPNARGSAGEVGLMQIKPSTARGLGYSGSASGLFHPETNIKYGMKYLGMAHQLSGGSTCGTILRYNAGHNARRMNPVSAAYCSKVKALIGG